MSNDQPSLTIAEKGSETESKNKPKKSHPWRMCPDGYHFVHTHQLHTKPGKKHPQGQVVTRHGHCAKNPSRKDLMTYDEIRETTWVEAVAEYKGVLIAFLSKDAKKTAKSKKVMHDFLKYYDEISAGGQ